LPFAFCLLIFLRAFAWNESEVRLFGSYRIDTP